VPFSPEEQNETKNKISEPVQKSKNTTENKISGPVQNT
jgi:hypothetical protein